MTSIRTITAAATLITVLMLTGCATSRIDQLHRKADKVESNLKAEQKRVLAMNAADQSARLDHLTGLRATLSAANVGLGAVPHLVDVSQRDVAYDVIEEVYDTIDWNIPMGPSDAKRALPAQFQSGVLRLDQLGTNQPPRPANITK